MTKIERFEGEFRWLSNFWPADVVLDGIKFPTTEHAYQAAKTTVISEREAIAKLPNPGQAKRAGRTVTIRPDWNEVRLGVMLQLLRQKFARQPLKGKLVETGTVEIIEGNSWNDTFWGVSGGKGENHLGKLLMQVREELKAPTKKHNLRVIVCGGRTFALPPDSLERRAFVTHDLYVQARKQAVAEREIVFNALDKLHALRRIEVVIHGAAKGADSAAEDWSRANNVPSVLYPITPEMWKQQGKKAGYLRNMAMLKETAPDAVVAFPGGAGTTIMIDLARTAEVPVWEPTAPRPDVAPHAGTQASQAVS